MALKQKHALVTGGSRGIGRGIALKLAENGVKVGVHYYRNESAAKDTLEEVRSAVLMGSWCRPTSACPTRSRECSARSKNSSGNSKSW